MEKSHRLSRECHLKTLTGRRVFGPRHFDPVIIGSKHLDSKKHLYSWDCFVAGRHPVVSESRRHSAPPPWLARPTFALGLGRERRRSTSRSVVRPLRRGTSGG